MCPDCFAGFFSSSESYPVHGCSNENPVVKFTEADRGAQFVPCCICRVTLDSERKAVLSFPKTFPVLSLQKKNHNTPLFFCSKYYLIAGFTESPTAKQELV